MQELTADTTLLLVPLPSATAEEALQEWQAIAQASKGPAALHEQAQGVNAQGCQRPTGNGRQTSSRKGFWS